MNKYYLQVIAIAASLLSSITVAALCQNPPQNSPDRIGEYYRNEAPLKGTIPPPLMAGSLWQVATNKLNCRSGPGLSYPILRQWQKGDILQAEVGRGGADEVLVNSRDASGKPWMFVRGGQVVSLPLETKCYVRANSRYIQPYSANQ